jgi:hypothetical protein
VKVGRVIARRQLTRGRRTRPVALVEIGQPRKTRGHDDFFCPFRIKGVGDESVRAAYGVDAVQAMQLVSKAVAAELFRFPDLTWLGMVGTGFPAADESLPMEWARALDATSTAPPDEPVVPAGVWPPLEFYAATSRAIRGFFFTKNWLPRMWLRSDVFPPQTDAVVHHGMPSRRQCDLLRAHAKKSGVAMRFVGDLDPLDLSVFVALQAGGAPLRTRLAPPVPVIYAGIDDSWLALCEHRIRDREIRTVLIPQNQTERKLLSELERSGVDIETLVGPRCATLLRDGLKLEIEGASNAAFYGKDFMAHLLHRLLRPPPRRRARVAARVQQNSR